MLFYDLILSEKISGLMSTPSTEYNHSLNTNIRRLVEHVFKNMLEKWHIMTGIE